ncbi:MAG: tRNA uridine-5-carboxymethylaminomethyl(34) synthesis enzyme MnmG [Oscillospiraceae bacterium]|nr:tRNA uridine-5-carboxymethylaminomethyl(34) synthesis enzyme MnmG [Oscillospiraceae bacterium]
MDSFNVWDAVVIGAGHAGCEAALALARMGARTLLLTLSLDAVAHMPCNPAIGGTGKGHLVREVDALGGEMGLAADAVSIQSRMLNRSKGPAVHSLRAQADKRAYHDRMLSALLSEPNITLRQAEVSRILTQNGRVSGVVTATGETLQTRAAIVAAGVYLDSRIIIGDYSRNIGPGGFMNASSLSDALRGLGFDLRRFKTGTPARLDARTIHFDRMEPQYGDDPPTPFSFMSNEPPTNRACCYLTWTNERTHAVIRANLHRAPMFTGGINGVGARYCPSIEDKITRFADKPRHQVFLEPEGLRSPEWYVQGVSTSLPEDVQTELIRTIPGLEDAILMRLAYAIEYDCIDPTRLDAGFGARGIPGLYFAGQINGTSGYEEAAAQGILAGINAALYLRGEPPFLIGRDEGYIGVLADDLTVKGTDEPYRMMTSRAEYRLLLRQDNADLRLTERAAAIGLASPERLERTLAKRGQTGIALNAINAERAPNAETFARWLAMNDQPPAPGGLPLADLLKRPGVTYAALRELCPALPEILPCAAEQAELTVKYEGYLSKQRREVDRARSFERRDLPPDVDYAALPGLRVEARQKLNRVRPATIGQASRIPGVSPADVAVLTTYLTHLTRSSQ